MNTERIAYLRQQYLQKNISSSELNELKLAVADPDLDEVFQQLATKIWLSEGVEIPTLDFENTDRIYQEVIAAPQQKKPFWLWPRIAVAASIAFAVTVAGYFYYNNRALNIQHTSAYANDISPGRSSATLTLANGRRILLSAALKGKVAEQAGVDISKTSDGQVVYRSRPMPSNAIGSESINMLSTAKGGKYQLVLPDGSKVWLNAASSLRFPATFAGAGQRKVELSGEAYFEIAKDKKHPFIVQSPKKQEIEVLGTHFNINSYADETAVRTTLVEGSVKVTSAGGEQRLLKPGQQASVSKGVINVEPANTEEMLAWKNGYFRFNDEKIENIMRQLSRWYSIEVVYEGHMPIEGFNGKVSRSKNISQVLKALESTKLIHFKIEGRRVTVMGE